MSAVPPARSQPTRHLALSWTPGLFFVLLVLFGAFGVLQDRAVNADAVRIAKLNSPAQQAPTPTLVPGTGAIVGLAWQDLNGNAAHEPDEPPLAGVLLSLAQQSGTVVATALTGDDGRYWLANVDPGLYQLSATPPPGYRLTTPDRYNVYVSAGNVLTIDFGAQFIPTPTPTATPVPRLDTDNVAFAWCGGVIHGTTQGKANNVSRYACRPHWPETGPEVVYRIELNRTQLFTAALMMSGADLDLFLLRTSYPDSCVAGGDTYVSYEASPGLYYLVVDGYDGAVGDFVLRVECPLEVQATATPTYTPSPTPTVTPTATPGPTATPTATLAPRQLYLPLVLRHPPAVAGPPSVMVLQQGVQGYSGVVDTTLSAWEPDAVLNERPKLSLRYNQQTAETTHMAPLLRFDLSLLPSGSQIISATLMLYVLELERPEDIRAEVYGLLVPWRDETATWRQWDAGMPWSRPGAQGEGSDHMAWRSDSQLINSSGRWVTFDVSALVSSWSARPMSNYGMVILAQAGESGSNLQVDFASSEYGEASLRPKLTVAYRVPVALANNR